MTYTLVTTVSLPWSEAVDRTREALAAEPEMGALLPCNVVVRRKADANETTVESIDPQAMVQFSRAAAVKEVADDAAARLRRALASLGGSVE